MICTANKIPHERDSITKSSAQSLIYTSSHQVQINDADVSIKLSTESMKTLESLETKGELHLRKS